MKSVGRIAVALCALLLATSVAAHAQEAPPAEAVSASSAPAAAKPPPSIAEFLAEPLISDVALAPGGGHYAYVRRQDDIAYLIVRDIRNPAAPPVARRLGAVRVYGLKWVNDDRLIYSAGANEFGIDVKRGKIILNGVPKLFASNRDLQDTLSFFNDEKRIDAVNVITTDDIDLITGDGEHFVVPLRVGRNLDLVRVNVRDGKWTTAASGSDRTVAWFVDSFGQPVMRFDTNRRYTEIRVMIPERRNGGRIDWKQAFAMRFDRAQEKAPAFTPIAPGPQPGLYYVVGRPDGADRAGVYLYNLEQQKYATEVFTHPRVDVEDGLIDSRTGIYIGATFWNDMLEATFIQGKMQSHFNALKGFFENERSIVFVDRSADQQVWILATSGPRDPGTYHIYDMANTHNEVIGAVNPLLTPDRLGKAEAITYTAGDGLQISGYLTLPPNLAEGAKPPLIVYPHGGPEARTALTFDLVAQFLATRGYAVFQPNFRGSSGYGQAFIEAGNRQFNGAMQTDITDGVQLLIDQGRVDASRICIFGESYGGYAALMGAVRSPSLYRCAVSFAGVTDLPQQLRWERDEEGDNSETYKYWVTKIGDPQRDKAAITSASPTSNVAAITIPVMLMHGKRDDTVPFQQFELMQKAMKAGGKEPVSVVFEDAGHNLGGADLEAYLGDLESFFAKHLPLPANN